VRVEFKFVESAPADQRKRVVEKLAQLGAEKVEPLFGDEQDPELASLYKAECVPDEKVESLIAELAAHEAVEFAERAPERKLIR
jgi:hypothetical protein